MRKKRKCSCQGVDGIQGQPFSDFHSFDADHEGSGGGDDDGAGNSPWSVLQFKKIRLF